MEFYLFSNENLTKSRFIIQTVKPFENVGRPSTNRLSGLSHLARLAQAETSLMSKQNEGAAVAYPFWVIKVTRRPDGERPHVQASFPKCGCSATQAKSFFTKHLKTLAEVERNLLGKVMICFV